jgi:hypothetical protein
VIAGQHPAFADLTTLNRTVWPIPLAALLPTTAKRVASSPLGSSRCLRSWG